MLFKKASLFAALAISTTFVAAPAISSAGALTIVNNTSTVTTSRVNDFICSDVLGPIGTTPPDGQDHVIDAETVKEMCQFTPDSCSAVVYAGAHCDGQKLAKVILSVNGGVVSAQQLGSYPISAPLHGFRVVLG